MNTATVVMLRRNRVEHVPQERISNYRQEGWSEYTPNAQTPAPSPMRQKQRTHQQTAAVTDDTSN
jgi:hypothetical protein